MPFLRNYNNLALFAWSLRWTSTNKRLVLNQTCSSVLAVIFGTIFRTSCRWLWIRLCRSVGYWRSACIGHRLTSRCWLLGIVSSSGCARFHGRNDCVLIDLTFFGERDVVNSQEAISIASQHAFDYDLKRWTRHGYVGINSSPTRCHFNDTQQLFPLTAHCFSLVNVQFAKLGVAQPVPNSNFACSWTWSHWNANGSVASECQVLSSVQNQIMAL